MENKKEQYTLMLAQAKGLLEMEQDKIASLANLSALLHDSFPKAVYSGFYLFDGKELVLGPFQGKVSCTRISLGKGVCGQAAKERKTLVVNDVSTHQNYISCDCAAKSEIVVPLVKENVLYGVLDLDASEKNVYQKEEKEILEKVVTMLMNTIY